MSRHFNLVDQPWIPVITAEAPTPTEMSLVEVFAQAGSIRRLAGEIPTQEFAIMRLLLAILTDATRPASIAAWDALWQQIPVDVIKAYLDRHRERFWLIHPQTPFMQVADLHTRTGNTSGVRKLVADFPDGHPYFTTRTLSTLSFAEAARWLVHLHAYDYSGIKSGAIGTHNSSSGRGVPMGVGWAGGLGGIVIEGASLHQSLVLNLVPSDYLPVTDSRDAPVWARPQLGAAPEQREPYGPMDLFTWQSRRVRLYTDAEIITDALVANGSPLEARNMQQLEPMSAWWRSPHQERKHGTPAYMPLKPTRRIWQHLPALLTPAPAGNDRPPASLPPLTLDFHAHHQIPAQMIRLHTYGIDYGTNMSVISDVRDDHLTLPAELLHRQDLAEMVIEQIEACEAVISAYSAFGKNLALAAGTDPSQAQANARFTMTSAVDDPVRRWLHSLDTAKPDFAYSALRDTVEEMATAMGEDMVTQAPATALFGRSHGPDAVTTVRAQLWYRRALQRIFRPDETS